MTRPDQIPDEVVRVAARAMCAADGFDPDAVTDNHTPTCPGPTWRLWVNSARAAITAALSAWPGALRIDGYEYGVADVLHLPLPPEGGDA